MGNKVHQVATTIQEQIDNLCDLGLSICDVNRATFILSHVSYYRLIKAYGIEFKENDGNYIKGTTFESIVKLYELDAELRHIVLSYIETIEISLRTSLANHIGIKYGPLAYLDRSIIQTTEYYDDIIGNIQEMVERNKKSPIVRNFQIRYVDGKLPIYALVEVCSFGDLSKFYKVLKSEDKKEIAKIFGVGYTYAESWMETLVFVRNVCAHYGRLYNSKIKKKPRLYKQYTEVGVTNDSIFAVLLCVKRLLDKEKKQVFLTDICQFISKMESENVDVSRIGVCKEWKEILFEA